MPLKTTEWHRRRLLDRDATSERLAEFSKDYDRILYSTAFRRLGGVTQVVASSELALVHTRLTHSLKTAQVGTRLAHHLKTGEYASPRWQNMIEEFGGLESRVVRAACLAHDLGHPPFGHTGETELQRITSPRRNQARPKQQARGASLTVTPPIAQGYDLRDRFSSSAQSFRIVTKLASRVPPEHPDECPALNLTRGTLAGMMKYPWPRGKLPSGINASKREKWGFYDSESAIAAWIFADDGVPEERQINARDRKWEYRTLEAQVMDWADDISYAVHDVEDFFRAGLIPLDRLAVSPSEWEAFFNYAWLRRLSKLFAESEKDKVKKWGEEVTFKIFPQSPFEGSSSDRINLHKFASSLISDVTDGTRLYDGGAIIADDEYLAVIELLKQLTWYYVLERPSMESVHRGQRRLIRSLYCDLIEWVTEVWDGPGELSVSHKCELPARLLELLDVAYLYDPSPDDDDDGDSGNKRVSRAVIDYIVSLTEGQVLALNARLSGQSLGSVLDNWLVL